MPLSTIPTPVLRAELIRRTAGREISADASFALVLITRAGMSYGLSPQQVLSKRRPIGHCHARWAVWTILAHAGWQDRRTAAVFAVERATVAHGIHQASLLIGSDRLFAGTLLLLRDCIGRPTPALNIED